MVRIEKEINVDTLKMVRPFPSAEMYSSAIPQSERTIPAVGLLVVVSAAIFLYGIIAFMIWS
jgi:hypothetical protein